MDSRIAHAMLALLFAITLQSRASAVLKIDAAYPGGNIVVEKIDGDLICIKPDQRDIKKGQWWFYWNFRVTGAAGRTLHFRFSGKKPLGVRGPALSRDGGRSWAWLGRKAVRTLESKPPAWEFDYQFASDDEVRFSFCIPYLQSDLERFLARHAGDPALKVETLCASRKGRAVEKLRLGKLGGEPKWRVLLTARHHACESTADYAMEGILETILSDTPEGRAWRENVEVTAIPFIDKDGVEDGDSGKNRAPHDHNRDYNETSLYPEVAALRKLAPEWSGGKLAVALDLHCPYIGGQNNEHIYFVGCQDQRIWAETTKLSKILESTRKGPLPYHAKGNIPYGTAWNTASNTTDGHSFGEWSRTLPGIRIGGSIEIPYANIEGAEVTADAARALGRDLARAIYAYLAME